MLIFSFLLAVITPSMADPLNVFVSIQPQKWVLDQIAGDLVTSHALVQKGQTPHNFEPKPKQLVQLSQASIYLTLDLPFEKVLIKKLPPEVPKIDTADGVKKRAFHRHGHDHHGQENDGHTKGENRDPHIWLSPVNLKIIAKNMATALSSQDPEHSKIYVDNLQLLEKKLDRLDEKITKELKPHAGLRFYVFHPSFGYFADRYNLVQEAVEIEGKSPGPKQISKLIAMAKKDQVKIIFAQPQFDKKSSEVIATAIGGQVIFLDPLAEDVVGNLEKMADKIASSLQ